MINDGPISTCKTMRASSRDDPLVQASRKCHKLLSLVQLATTKKRKKKGKRKVKKNLSKVKTAKTLGKTFHLIQINWILIECDALTIHVYKS